MKRLIDLDELVKKLSATIEGCGNDTDFSAGVKFAMHMAERTMEILEVKKDRKIVDSKGKMWYNKNIKRKRKGE